MIAFLAALAHSELSSAPTLIVCPATVLRQWKNEFEKWSPIHDVTILHPSASATLDTLKLIHSIESRTDVLVTTYEQLRIHHEDLVKRQWEYVVLDEGHKIRNPDAAVTLACKHFQTCHRLVLSGAPVQNNLKELWSIFDFVFPGKLGTLPVFQTQFEIPIALGGYANATEAQVVTAYKCACVLRDLITPYLLRRLKKDVSTTLPKKDEQVLFCTLSAEQRFVYKEYLKSLDLDKLYDGTVKV